MSLLFVYLYSRHSKPSKFDHATTATFSITSFFLPPPSSFSFLLLFEFAQGEVVPPPPMLLVAVDRKRLDRKTKPKDWDRDEKTETKKLGH